MAKTTRCKFECVSVEPHKSGDTVYQVDVKLMPFYDEKPENKAFWDATPAGSLELSISNVPAAEIFEVGSSYYIDISRAG